MHGVANEDWAGPFPPTRLPGEQNFTLDMSRVRWDMSNKTVQSFGPGCNKRTDEPPCRVNSCWEEKEDPVVFFSFKPKSKVKNTLKDKMMGDEGKRKKLQPKITSHFRAERNWNEPSLDSDQKISRHKNTKQRPLTGSITTTPCQKKTYPPSSWINCHLPIAEHNRFSAWGVRCGRLIGVATEGTCWALSN